MSIGTRIKEARINMGLTQEELANKIGVTKGAIGNYENEVSTPKIDLLYKLFDVLQCDANYFYQDEMKNTKKNVTLSFSEEKMVTRYRKLDNHGKEIIDIILDKEFERIKSPEKIIELPYESEPEHICGTLNLSDLKASAGTGNFLSEESMTPIQVDFNRLTAKADFAVPVEGDSMLPKYKDGDILLIQKQPSINVGEIGIFIIDGKGYVKKQGPDRLISLNEEYDDIYPGENDYTKCCGKVIGILKPEWILE